MKKTTVDHSQDRACRRCHRPRGQYVLQAPEHYWWDEAVQGWTDQTGKKVTTRATLQFLSNPRTTLSMAQTKLNPLTGLCQACSTTPLQVTSR